MKRHELKLQHGGVRVMKLFKRLFCKHEYKTLTNIHGDMRNTWNCSSIKECVKCGKWQKHNEIDSACNIVNFREK